MESKNTFSEFDDTNDSWIEYVERLEHFFVANDIETEAKKKSVMLSSCGNKTYRLFRNLLAPTKPGAASWSLLKETMENHVSPKPSVILERFRFNRRNRKIGESVPCYLAELRKLTEHCEYNDNFSDMLRDKLVCGINDTKIQQKLLSESQLTFDNAYKIASAMERAQNDVLDIQNESKESINRFSNCGNESINRVNYSEGSSNKMMGSKSGKNYKQYSFRCGRINHHEIANVLNVKQLVTFQNSVLIRNQLQKQLIY